MALFGRRRREREALLASAGVLRGFTAAATSVDLADDQAATREAQRHKKRPLQWQREAWENHDRVEIVRSGARWQSDCQSRIRLFPAVLDPENPEAPPTSATEAEGVDAAEVRIALDTLDRLRSDEEDRAEIQRVLGLNLFVAAECWLVGTDEEDEFRSRSNPTGERWRAFSVEELVPLPEERPERRWAIRPAPDARREEYEYLDPETTRLVRVYRRHGRWRSLPDGAMTAGNLLCEELILATQSILGALRSRLPAGILPVPAELELGEAKTDDDEEGESDDMDPVLRVLMEHLTAPLSDPRSAAALVPYLLKIPSELIEKMKLIDIAKQMDPELLKRLDHVIARLGIALDLPPAKATGTEAEATHWNIYELNKDGVRTYVLPYTGLYVNAIVSRIYRPRLEIAGVADPELWTIEADASDVMATPDLSENAIQGYEAMPPVIGRGPTAKALGFAEDEVPEDEELEEILAARRGAAAPAPNGEGPPRPPGEEPPRRDEEDAEEEPPPPPPGSDNGQRREPVQAAATPAPRQLGDEWARIEAQLTRDVLVAADAALRRTVERAQARIQRAASRAELGPDDEGRQQGHAARAVARLPLERIPSTLGAEEVERLGLTEEQLLAGGFGAAFERNYYSWTARARARALRALDRAGIALEPAALQEWDDRGARHAEEGWAVLVAGMAGAFTTMLFSPSGPDAVATAGEVDETLDLSPRIVKDSLTTAGGGPPAESASGGIVGGRDFAEFLDALSGFTRTGWLWATGAPERPFEPHEELEGAEFEAWDDEQLIADAGEFPYVPSYYPGDHDGCQCVAVPDGTAVIVSAEDDALIRGVEV